jgi:hypothetical protein
MQLEHDPCPSVQRVGHFSWQHVHVVRCKRCDTLVHFAFYLQGAHWCARCMGRD